MTAIEVPPQVSRLLESGALVVLCDSGGKDSQAMRILVRSVVPPEQLIVVHAHLREVEWPGAMEHARAGAERGGIPFVVAEARKSFFEMVEHRFAVRPGPGSPCWPSPANRQCTSDLKRGPIEREVRRVLAARGVFKVITCMGIRGEESPKRAKVPILQRSDRNSVAGREWWEWLPVHSLTRESVLSVVEDAGESLHPAYAAGNDRLSCMFCIMGSRKDLRNAALANPPLLERFIELEERTGYTMHASRIPLRQLVHEVRS